MAEVLVGTAVYSDGGQAAFYLEQDALDTATGCRVQVPAGHIAQVLVQVNGASPRTVSRFFPGAKANAALVTPAGAGGSDELYTFPQNVPAALDYSVCVSAYS